MYQEAMPGNKRKIRIKNLLLSMSFLCIIILMLAVGSRFFAIKDIKVTGNVSIASSEIIEVVSIYYDKNLLRIKQESVRLRLAETLPIEEVKVSYKLPGTLLINVREGYRSSATLLWRFCADR